MLWGLLINGGFEMTDKDDALDIVNTKLPAIKEMAEDITPKLENAFGEFITQMVPNGGVIVSMVTHKDNLIVATKDVVYRLSDDGLFTPISFKAEDNE